MGWLFRTFSALMLTASFMLNWQCARSAEEANRIKAAEQEEKALRQRVGHLHASQRAGNNRYIQAVSLALVQM